MGFATAFELVVLAWSSARRGITDAVVAAVVGSYAYNVTMTLGLAAVITPLGIDDTSALRGPLLAMLASLAAVLILARTHSHLDRRDGVWLLAGYAVFVIAIVAT